MLAIPYILSRPHFGPPRGSGPLPLRGGPARGPDNLMQNLRIPFAYCIRAGLPPIRRLLRPVDPHRLPAADPVAPWRVDGERGRQGIYIVRRV